MFRSVVVVCKNMNATDIEKLVPGLALSGCSRDNNVRMDTNSSNVSLKGHCVELAKTGGRNCSGEPELCHVSNDVLNYDNIHKHDRVFTLKIHLFLRYLTIFYF